MEHIDHKQMCTMAKWVDECNKIVSIVSCIYENWKIDKLDFRCQHIPRQPSQTKHTCSLQWRHNGRDGVSNHQHHDCLLNRSFRRRSKKTSKLRVTGLCAGKSPGTGEFPTQMASYAENVSIWWRHHYNYLTEGVSLITITDLISKSHNAPVPYQTM